MQRAQLRFLKVLLQDIGFPCHKVVTLTCIRASPVVNVVFQLVKCDAKYFSNESDVLPLFTRVHTSPRWRFFRRLIFRLRVPDVAHVVVLTLCLC